MVTKNNTFPFKKLETQTFQEFDKLLNKTRDFAEKKGVKPSDVEKAIYEVRQK